MKKPRNKIVLGVTGGYGTGKSTVTGILKSYGAEVIDADKMAHGFLLKNTFTYKKILKIFGQNILDSRSKNIDRKKLAEIVFDNKKLLVKLENIIHPAVVNLISHKLERTAKHLIILDLPLLYEVGLEKMVDKVVVVKTNKANQLERLKKRSFLSRQEILSRINAQMPLSLKVRKADFVIDNNGSLEKTKKQVENLRRLLWRN